MSTLGLWPVARGLSSAWARAKARAGGGDRPVALVEYQERPLEFFEEILGISRHTIRWSLNPGYEFHVWDGTKDPLEAICLALVRGEHVGVESATGTGKSFLLALIYLWFVACWDGARVFTFAPKEDQLRIYSWMELDKLWWRFKRKFPRAVKTDLRIRMIPGSDEWGVQGWAVQLKAGEQVSSRAAGMHAAHMLLVYEEGQGCDYAVIKSGRQTCTAPHNMQLVVGNPLNQQDPLHEFCQRPGVRGIRISALDHPNVVRDDADIIPGAVSTKSLEERALELGGAEHPLYKSHARGISPSESKDALIKKAWIDRAIERYYDPRYRVGLRARGVDVANSEAGDRGAIARGIGACLLEVVTFPCPRADRLAVRVALEMAMEGIDEKHVGVDAIGVGASCVNKFYELELRIQALNGGGKPEPSIDEDLLRKKDRTYREEEVYENLRAQMHWAIRQDLQFDRIALPNDPVMIADLLALEWFPNTRGKIQVLSKEELRDHLRRSPDAGDAVVYWNWVRHRGELPPPDKELTAWSPEMLEAEMENRRIREKPLIRGDIPVTALEYID